jgi:hypothetical protein
LVSLGSDEGKYGASGKYAQERPDIGRIKPAGPDKVKAPPWLGHFKLFAPAVDPE